MQEHTQVPIKSAKQSKRAKLLSNQDIRRWYDNLARASIVTAEVRLRRLGHFCEVHNITPLELVDMAMKDLRVATDFIQDHVTNMEQQNHAAGYIESTLTAVKSWLRHFDIEIRRKIRISNPDSTPTLESERVPNEEEMTEIFNRASLKASACISLIAKGGLRPQVLGNFDGTDGLVMKDLPDIAIIQGTAVCMQYPPKVVVRKTLSKARHQYFTFLTTHGTKSLLAYLNERLYNKNAPPITADSPLIAPDLKYDRRRGGNNAKKFLPTIQISRTIRETLRPRFDWRPYVFRAYFDTQLLIAESKGKIAHDFRVFFMGHKGSIEAKYTTNKGILPEALTNEMRESFKRSEEFLDLELKQVDVLTKKKEQLHTAIERATPEKVQEILAMLSIGNT